jgi:hypothetical protein
LAYQKDDDLLVFLKDVVIPKKVQDAIGQRSAGLNLFMSSGETNTEGGRKSGMPNDGMFHDGKFFEPKIRFARSDARGSFEGRDVLNTDPKRKYDRAKFQMRSYYCGDMSITLDEKLQNRPGESFAGSRFESDVDGAVSDMMDMLATGIYNSDASRTGLQAKGIYGLRTLCNIDRTWGTIDSTNYSWWDGYIDSTAYSLNDLANPNSGNHIYLDVMRGLHNNTWFGGQGPTHYLTTIEIWDILEDYLLSKNLGSQINNEGSLGYKSINFRGAEVYADPYCPDNHMFAINQKGLGGQGQQIGLKGRTGGWFHMTPPQRAHKQLVWDQFLVSYALLWCVNPRYQASATGLGTG